MKKLYLFFITMITMVFSSFGQTTLLSPPTCLPTGAGTALPFSFTMVPQAASAATLTVYFQGDFDGTGGNLENADIFDENGVLIGITTPTGQCQATDSVVFIIPIADIGAWAADGTINFNFDPTAAVNPTLCNACEPIVFKLEYAPLTGPDDAAMTSVDSPYVFCAGPSNVLATIRNSGTNRLNSVDVNWEVNGIAQPVFNYTSVLDTLGGVLPNSAQLVLGSAPFVAGNNIVKVYTSNPNGVADTSNVNDTLSVTVVSAAAPTLITTSSATLTSIDVNAVGGAGTIDYEFGPFGFAPGTGTIGSSPTSTFTLSGLTQGTTYDVYVRSNCGSADISSNVGPETFNTSFGLPFSQDFGNFANNFYSDIFPEGWTAAQAAVGFPVPRWQSNIATGNSVGFQTGPIWDNTNYGSPSAYMLLNAPGRAIDSVDLLSPPIFVDSAVDEIEIGYYHFNFGTGVERVEVLADTNGVETLLATHTGSLQATQQDPWLFNTQRISGVSGQSVTIIFRGYNAAAFSRGNIGIDDITVDPILPLNAGVLEIQSPSGALCPGTITPIVGVKNFGSTVIDSVNVVWGVNGVRDSVMHVGQIFPGDTASVTLGNVTISAALVYDIEFYTNNPNGTLDQFAGDDTLSVDGLRTGLSGIYTLDPVLAASSSNFTSFGSLEAALNNYGMCGPSTVNVAAGTYNEVLYLDNPAGLTSTNNLTIDGGDSSLVILANDLSNDDAVIRFNNASFVTIKNMTVSTSRVGGGNHAVIHLGNESNNDSIVGVRVLLDPTATFGSYGIMASQLPTNTFTGGLHASNIVVMNSSINGGDNSIRFIGNGGRFPVVPAASGWAVGNKFINNTSTNSDDIAFYLDDQDSIEVIGNTISDMRTTSTFTGYGIQMPDGMNFLITANEIVVPYTGIYVQNANVAKVPDGFAEVSNNMISSQVNHALWLQRALSVNIWNNSVYCGSADALNDAGIYLDDGFGTPAMDNIDLRNNVVFALNAPAFRVDEPDTIFLKLDNNVYHTGGVNLLNIDGAIYADLVTYQGVSTALNSSSLDGDPQFASVTDLHIVGSFINDAGDNSVPLLVDIDGDARPIAGATTMDPGADEFNPPTCSPPVNLRGFNLNSNGITAQWDGVVGDYQYELVPAGTTPGTGTIIASLVDSIVVTGLNPSTSFDFNAREVCGRGDTSVWITYSFTTLIQGPLGVNCISGNASALVTEEFDAQGLWTGNIGTGAGSWVINTGGTGSFNTGPSAAHSGVNYIYYEASGGVVNAKMVSPAIDLTGASDSAEMSFWMHCFGADMGILNVGVSTSPTGPFATVFTQNGQLQTANADPWQAVGIRIDTMVGSTFYVEFDYTDGTGFTGDMSIDLFEVNSCISCAAPNTLVDSSVTATSADLAWIQNGTALGWEVEYGVSGFALGTGTRIASAGAPASIAGLATITSYDWYVRAICSIGDTSIWASSQFETPCAPFTTPYYTGFERMTTNINADCWSDFLTPYSVASNVWVRAFGGANGPSVGRQALYLYPQFNWNSAIDTVAAITPQFTDLTSGTKRIRFDANTDDAAAVKLIVGTVNIPGAGGVYTPVDTLTFSANDVYANYLVEFTTANGYNGSDEYIYLAHDLNTTAANFDYIRIDEFRYEEIPSCIRPSNLLTSNVTQTSIDLDWTENNTATTWEVSYGAPGFVTGSGTQVITTVKPYSLTGLTPSSSYEYYVRSICAAGDTSFWEGGLFMRTANGIPYTEDWEGLLPGLVSANLPNGWTTTRGANPRWELEDATGANENSTATGPFFDATTPTVIGGMYAYLETSGGGLGDADTLRSPSVAVPVNPLPMQLSYSYHMFGGAMGSMEVFIDSAGTLVRLDSLGGSLMAAGSDAWLDTTISLPGGMGGTSFSLVFVGIRGSSYTSDMSIDNILVDFTVGIEDETSTIEGISIAPNPSNGLFTMNIETPSMENFNMTVRDAQGRSVYTANFDVNGTYRNDLDFTSFAKGVYYMQIQTEAGMKVEKLIIQ